MLVSALAAMVMGHQGGGPSDRVSRQSAGQSEGQSDGLVPVTMVSVLWSCGLEREAGPGSGTGPAARRKTLWAEVARTITAARPIATTQGRDGPPQGRQMEGDLPHAAPCGMGLTSLWGRRT